MLSATPVISPKEEIDVLCLSILRRLHSYWRSRELPNSTGSLFHYWEEFKPFSARFLADVMLGYLAIGLHDHDSSALEKVRDLFSAIVECQEADGSFRWNLYDAYSPSSEGIRDQVDLGMILDAMEFLIHFQILTTRQVQQARELVRAAAAHLITSEWPEHPGIIRKRYYETKPQLPIDVLNAEALAAKSLIFAAKFNNESGYFTAGLRILRHLQSRFGRHYESWWPYSESLTDQSVVSPLPHGRSVFFQSMMVIHLSDLTGEPIMKPFHSMVTSAAQRVAEEVNEDGHLKTECESRLDCIGKPNALVADCLLRLRDPRATAKAQARLEYLSIHFITDDGNVLDEQGRPILDMWRIWLFSDVARLWLRSLIFR